MKRLDHSELMFLDYEVARLQGWYDVHAVASGSGGQCLVGHSRYLPKEVELPPFSASAESYLPLDEGDELFIVVRHDDVTACINDDEPSVGNTIAEARCRAWLVHKGVDV